VTIQCDHARSSISIIIPACIPAECSPTCSIPAPSKPPLGAVEPSPDLATVPESVAILRGRRFFSSNNETRARTGVAAKSQFRKTLIDYATAGAFEDGYASLKNRGRGILMRNYLTLGLSFLRNERGCPVSARAAQLPDQARPAPDQQLHSSWSARKQRRIPAFSLR